MAIWFPPLVWLCRDWMFEKTSNRFAEINYSSGIPYIICMKSRGNETASNFNFHISAMGKLVTCVSASLFRPVSLRAGSLSWILHEFYLHLEVFLVNQWTRSLSGNFWYWNSYEKIYVENSEHHFNISFRQKFHWPCRPERRWHPTHGVESPWNGFYMLNSIYRSRPARF